MTSSVILHVLTLKISHMTFLTHRQRQLCESADFGNGRVNIFFFSRVGKVNEIDNPDLSVKIDGIITMNRRIQLTTLCDLPKGASEFNCSLKIGTDMFDADMMIFSNMSSFDIDKMVVAHSLKLTDSFFELKNVTQPNENITESMYAEFDCTLTLSETGYGSGVASHGPMLLVLMAVVIAMFAQK